MAGVGYRRNRRAEGCFAFGLLCGIACATKPSPAPVPPPTATSATTAPPAAAAPSVDLQSEPWRGPSDATPASVERIPDEGGKISVVDVWPFQFRKEAPKGFGFAKAMLGRVRSEVKSKRWKEELRTRCRTEHGFPQSLALVTDDRGHIRALTDDAGTDDSAQAAVLLYDEAERIRFLFVAYRHYTGTVSEELAAFDARGVLTACKHLLLKIGAWTPNFCAKPEPEHEPAKLDPAVRRVLRPQPKAEVERIDPRLAYFVALRPREAFERCLPESAPRADAAE